MNGDVKGLLQSKTVWGVILQMVALVAISQGWDIGDADGWVELITGGVGFALALYGRITAVKRIALPSSTS